MAQLSDDPIQPADMEEFLRSESDFAFEMQVLHKLRTFGYDCEHGGTYQDPIMERTRQFDIRALIVDQPPGHIHARHLRLAVECKNLRDNHPLLVHAVRRITPEAYHQVLYPQKHDSVVVHHTITVDRYESLYTPDGFVGKQTDQVGRRQNGLFVRADADAFDKISQAINSSYDLIVEATREAAPTLHVIVPVLVVPGGTLWQVDYSPNGDTVTAARQVSESTLYLGRKWIVDRAQHTVDYCVSHLEIVTLDGLKNRSDLWRRDRGFFTVAEANVTS